MGVTLVLLGGILRRRQIWIGLLGVSGMLSASAGLGALLFLDWLDTPAGNRWATTQMETLATSALGEGSVQLGSVHTDFYSELSIEALRILDGEGQELYTMERLDVQMDPYALQNEQLLFQFYIYPKMSASPVTEKHGTP